MSVLDPQKTYKNLKKKGFIDSTTKSVDHRRLEFYYLYKRLQSLNADSLTNHNQLIKNILTHYIEKVEQ
jgi:hypothetical protein